MSTDMIDEPWTTTEKEPLPIREHERKVKSGLGVLAVCLVMLLGGIIGFVVGSGLESVWIFLVAIVLIFGGIIGLAGLFIVNPNEAKVLQLFGDYRGTVHATGLHWANPFYVKTKVSVRVRNFESGKLKVNDHDGNPIEIAAVVVWRVIDTAEALFHVENYTHFVQVQSESALRNLTTSYPYDSHDDEVALRSHTAEVAEHLKTEIQDRLTQAGVEVIEARISHLAYAPEIAHAMLQRQQAGAVIAARQKIVEGAVGMVEMALEMLSHQNIVDLDNDRKAQMVCNLLVVLCGERGTQPIVNAGSSSTHS